VLVEVLGDPALADLVGPVLGVEPGQSSPSRVTARSSVRKSPFSHGTVGVDERTTALQFGLPGLGEVVVGDLEAGQFDAQPP
jgi:hypothetical protein